jgi:hypothetical protein
MDGVSHACGSLAFQKVQRSGRGPSATRSILMFRSARVSDMLNKNNRLYALELGNCVLYVFEIWILHATVHIPCSGSSALTIQRDG